LAVLDLSLVAVEGSGWRSRDHLAILIKHSVVAGAKELSLFLDPTHTAAKVGADIGHHHEVATVFCQYINRKFFLIEDPSSLAFDLNFK
jgi:hypothetical protein